MRRHDGGICLPELGCCGLRGGVAVTMLAGQAEVITANDDTDRCLKWYLFYHGKMFA